MKYLKIFNETLESKVFELQISGFEESDIQDVFEPYINFELIKDAQDMSLDYIDDGMTLNLEITYDDIYYFYYMRYNHSGPVSSWMVGFVNNLTEGPYELEPIDKSKIVYLFYFNGSDRKIKQEANNELESRLREAYPDYRYASYNYQYNLL